MSFAGGFRLGPYEVLSALGAGGMGEVYKARDTRLDRTVASKVLPGGAAALPEVNAAIQTRSARRAGFESSAHMQTVRHRQPERDSLVMEYLGGETAAERVKSRPLPVEQALHFGIDIAGAREGGIHRDLKPANIIFTPMGPKILDFGPARIAQAVAAVSGRRRNVRKDHRPPAPATAPLLSPDGPVGLAR
jgi:serine/threonine protein kinase